MLFTYFASVDSWAAILFKLNTASDNSSGGLSSSSSESDSDDEKPLLTASLPRVNRISSSQQARTKRLLAGGGSIDGMEEPVFFGTGGSGVPIGAKMRKQVGAGAVGADDDLFDNDLFDNDGGAGVPVSQPYTPRRGFGRTSCVVPRASATQGNAGGAAGGALKIPQGGVARGGKRGGKRAGKR